jgi:hypothetical protein
LREKTENNELEKTCTFKSGTAGKSLNSGDHKILDPPIGREKIFELFSAAGRRLLYVK